MLLIKYKAFEDQPTVKCSFSPEKGNQSCEKVREAWSDQWWGEGTMGCSFGTCVNSAGDGMDPGTLFNRKEEARGSG